MATNTYIDIKKARELLEKEIGFKPPASVIHVAVKNKRVKSQEEESSRRYYGNKKVLMYNRADLKKMAQAFNQARGTLISLEDAYKLFQERRKESLSQDEFLALVQTQNIPPIAAKLWQHLFFDRLAVVEAAVMYQSKSIKELLAQEPVIEMTEARKLLEEKSGRKIDESTLHKMLERGTLTSAGSYQDAGGRVMHRFYKSALEGLSPRDYHKVASPPLPTIKLHDSESLRKLEEQHGPLVDTVRAIEIIRAKAGRNYNTASAKKLLDRQVGAVAYMGHTKLYPKNRVERLITHPLTGRPIAVKREPLRCS